MGIYYSYAIVLPRDNTKGEVNYVLEQLDTLCFVDTQMRPAFLNKSRGGFLWGKGGEHGVRGEEGGITTVRCKLNKNKKE